MKTIHGKSALSGALASAVLLIGAWGVSSARAAGIPARDVLTYAGVLEEDGGPVDGVRPIRVELYNTASGGAPLCFARSATAAVESGRFRMPLPDCTRIVRAERELWAEVRVNDVPLLPRQKLGGVPYAVEAERAQTALSASGPLATSIADKAEKSASAIVTGWAAFPGALSTNSAAAPPATVESARWRRVGDSLELAYFVRITGTWPTADMVFLLPPGLQVGAVSVGGLAGTALTYVSSGAQALVACRYGGAGNNCFISGNFGRPESWIAGEVVTMTATFPITGWTATGL